MDAAPGPVDGLAIRVEKRRLAIGPEDTPLAFLDFRRERRPRRLVLEHTVVAEALQGRGVGRRLVDRAVALAREEGRTVGAECPYAASVLAKDPAYADVRDAGP